eukprot:g30224.t1
MFWAATRQRGGCRTLPRLPTFPYALGSRVLTRAVTSQSTRLPDERAAPTTKHSLLRCFLLPHWGLETEMSVTDARESVHSMATQAGLLFAIMGGVSATVALMLAQERTSVGDKPVDAQLAHRRAEVCVRLGLPPDTEPSVWAFRLSVASLFLNLQGLMTSMLVASWVWAVPEAGLATLLQEIAWTIGMTGWMIVPAVATLGAGVVALTMHAFPEETYLVGSSYVLMGCASTVQMFFVHHRAMSIRAALRRQLDPARATTTTRACRPCPGTAHAQAN